ncbi:MAG: Crp/Fnr family transcriptional regulator [Allosphingosinicella sp.]|uniref:Crp/Fnr family transcriptional regulator n=1 Tax=Allosphingosinicella sp. TaxID=2823234 RepID=UPI003958CFCF
MLPKQDLQPFLDRLTSRSRLSESEQKAILGLPTHTAQVSTNRDFVRLDERVDHACVVVEGVVGRFGQTSEGARQITAFFVAGDAPDLHSVVLPRDSSALQALSTTTILRIPHSALRAVAGRYPAVAEAFWRDCSVDAAVAAQWVVNVGRRDARTRMAHLLCEMAVRYDMKPLRGEVTYAFPVTQAHLADATGLTSVHVNRTLKALAAEDLVIVASRSVRILDWEKLAKVGEFNAGYLQADYEPDERLRIVG